jgi:hypothetical protein
MPLRDHFHPPLSKRRSWKPFHGAWATYFASYLNRILPKGYFAEPFCTFAVEIDVATIDRDGKSSSQGTPEWTPPEPTLTLPMAAATDTVEVRVYKEEGGAQLAGCIELVSPSNKDRPEEREAFVSKCASYLHDGAGLVVVDVVTERRANLHTSILARVSPSGVTTLKAPLYAVSYRPVPREELTDLNVWEEGLAIGQPLPTMPFWLKAGPCLRLDLEATYEQTCQELRLQSNGAAGAKT